MKTDQGAMSFEAEMNNSKFIAAIDEAEKRVKGFSKATVAEGLKIDDTFDLTTQNIKVQKDAIESLENQIKTLDAEIGKLSPGKAQAELKQQAAQVKVELDAEKNALKFLEQQVEATETAHVSLRTQLRLMREEMIQMEAAGLRGTDAYQALQKKAGDLKDAIGDAQAQMSVMANDEKGFQGVVSALSGVTGAFSAAQGVVGLFAGENENLNKIMLKVQSLMAITIGLQQVAETLNKDSYFNVVILTKAKEMLAVAELKVATAMGISTVAARVLMATLTLGLSVAITAIIMAIDKFTSMSKEAKKATEEFNKSVAESAIKPVSALQELMVGWSELGNSIKAKEKFIDDNAEKFKLLGVAVNGVKDAEALFADGGKRFIEALIVRAKAMATAELAAEKYKQAIQKQLELDKTPQKVTKTKTVTDPETSIVLSSYSYEVDNKDYSKLKTEKDKLEKEGLDLFKKAAEFTAQEKKVLKDIGVSADNITKGSITALENSISKLKTKYKDAATDTERVNLLKQIKAQEKVLDKMDQTDSSSKDPFKEKLDKRKKQYQDYFKWVNSSDPILKKAADTEFSGMLKQGKSFLEYLKKQRDQLLSVSDQTASQKAQLKTINGMIAEETKKTVLQSFEESLQKQMNSATSILQMLDIIAKKRKELSGDGSDIDTGKKDILNKADEDVEKTAKEQTDKLVEDYASYLTKKLQLQQKYTDDMMLLEKRLKAAQTPEEKVKVQGAIDNRTTEYKKENKGSGDADYDALVIQYRNYEEKKQAIIDDFEERRKKAKLQGNEDLVNRINEDEKKTLSTLSVDKLFDSNDFTNVFNNIATISAEKIEALKTKIKDFLDTSKGTLSSDDLKAVTEALNELNSVSIERSPFSELTDSLSEYLTASKDVSTAQEKLNRLSKQGKKGTQEYSNAEKDLSDAQTRKLKSANKMGEAFEKSKEKTDSFTSALKSLGDAIGGDVGKGMNQVSDIINITMSGISGIVQLVSISANAMTATATSASASMIALEKASVILAIISAAIQLTMMVVNMLAGENEATKYYNELKGTLEGYIEVLDKIIAKQTEVMEGLVGMSAALAASAIEETINKEIESYRQLAEAAGAAGASMGSHSYAYRSNKSMRDYWDEISKSAGVTITKVQDLYGLTAEQLEKVRDENPYAWALMSDEISQYLDKIIDASSDIEDLMETVKESVLGINFEGVRDGLDDLLLDADTTMEDIADNFEDYMKNAMLNIVKSKYLTNALSTWYDDFYNYTKSGEVLTEDEVSALRDSYSSIFKNAQSQLQAMADVANLDLDSESSSTSVSGAIQNVSEETASVISGQMNAIRINQAEANAMIKTQLMYLAEIAFNTRYNKYLMSIDSKMDSLSGDSLRSQGL